MSAPLPMNPEVRAAWVKALRSGEYAQGRDYLRTDDGFCCLGVLCDLALKEGVVVSTWDDNDGAWAYGNLEGYSTTLLPLAVVRWAGLMDVTANEDDGGDLRLVVRHPDSGAVILRPATSLNDTDRATFATIADAIDGKEPQL